MAIERSLDEFCVTSDLRQDLRRRVAESLGAAGAAGVLYAVLSFLGVSLGPVAAHFMVGASLPWIAQLLALPNSLGGEPIPSHTVHITATHVSLSRYGVEYGRIARPVVLRPEPWWSPLEGIVLRGTDGHIRLRSRALATAEVRALETILAAGEATEPRVGSGAA